MVWLFVHLKDTESIGKVIMKIRNCIGLRRGVPFALKREFRFALIFGAIISGLQCGGFLQIILVIPGITTASGSATEIAQLQQEVAQLQIDVSTKATKATITNNTTYTGRKQ